MRLIHTRFSKDSDMVFSKLTLPWLNYHPDVYGGEPLKCIPVGIYKCVPYPSPARQEDCWLLEGVTGHDGIEIHAGNYGCDIKDKYGNIIHKADTHGCLMYGFSLDESIPMLLRSKEATQYLHTTIGLKSSFELEIINNFI